MHIQHKPRARKWFPRALIFSAMVGLLPSVAICSDHTESPLVKQDASMDLTDLYVFDSGGGKMTVIVNWAGFNDSRAQPDAAPLFTSNSLYTINIDNNEDNVADFRIQWKFGQNSQGQWGVQVTGIPGSQGTVSGPVERILSGGNGTRVWAGHADDPFFFDVQGYLDTLATGVLSIINTRSILSGFNVTALAVEFDIASVVNSGGDAHFWITSARK